MGTSPLAKDSSSWQCLVSTRPLDYSHPFVSYFTSCFLVVETLERLSSWSTPLLVVLRPHRAPHHLLHPLRAREDPQRPLLRPMTPSVRRTVQWRQLFGLKVNQGVRWPGYDGQYHD